MVALIGEMAGFDIPAAYSMGAFQIVAGCTPMQLLKFEVQAAEFVSNKVILIGRCCFLAQASACASSEIYIQ